MTKVYVISAVLTNLWNEMSLNFVLALCNTTLADTISWIDSYANRHALIISANLLKVDTPFAIYKVSYTNPANGWHNTIYITELFFPES